MQLGWRGVSLGLFLVLAGAIPLAAGRGWLSADALAGLPSLWPLVLIALGTGLVLRVTRLAALSGLLVAGVLGITVGSALAVGPRFPGLACGRSTSGGQATDGEGTLSSAAATVQLRVDCGDLDVSTRPGDGWRLAATGGSAPQVVSTPDRLGVESGGRDGPPFVGARGRESWRIELPQDPRLSVDVSVDAGTARLLLARATLETLTVEGDAADVRLDLEGATVGRLSLQLDAGNGAVRLPAGVSLTGTIEANAARVALCRQPGAAISVTADDDDPSASHNYAERGLTRVGDAWRSTGYETATNRIVLRTEGSAVRYELDPEGGCA